MQGALNYLTTWRHVENLVHVKISFAYGMRLLFECVIPISCGAVVEHCIRNVKVVGSIPREPLYWQKMYNLNAL